MFLIMGHVDSGKTQLLKRLAPITLSHSEYSEYGNVTQGIKINRMIKKTILFIDTPGHESFNAALFFLYISNILYFMLN